MNCSRNDNQAKHLKKVALLAAREGKTESQFVAQFKPAFKSAASSAYRSWVFSCDSCDAPFVRRSDKTKHEKRWHGACKTGHTEHRF
jgi:hypothetical protein